ncbi:MAG TPA: efflux RND transporter permease subunit [Kofleriaceae bacterium]|nr:efflux RND transporter permease subunit [Kofleriaceae bacterium]
MLATFVRRPVLAAVISIVLVLLGLVSLARMPMSLLPAIAPPEVNVTVTYTGANAGTVIKAAVVPLERAINGVPGMKYMASTAGNDGTGVVQVLFETGTDPDVASINVQNRVNTVLDELPDEVRRAGVSIEKEEPAMLMFVSLYSTNKDQDETFLYNFADINLLAELKRVPGVGVARIMGAKDYAMRVWIKPDKLATYGLAVDDVLAALRAYNIEAAPGTIGENSGRGHTPLQYTLTYRGKLTDDKEYRRIPIRSRDDGTLVRLEDVADVELGSMYFDNETKLDGRPAAAIELRQRPGSNAREVIREVKHRLDKMKHDAFLPGMDYKLSYDVSRFLDASVHEVIKTLLEAFVLVSLIVFLFLQNVRATLVPIIAVPVSLVGTLIFAKQLGFSLNMITLFALVLSIGIVVDNAIVVVEAVHAKLEHGHMGAREASEQAIRELGPAIVAITLVMAAVFVPLAFITGPAGVFYKQFGLTTAIAITLSGVVALTLTPALCAVLMRRHQPMRLLRWFDRGYARVEATYARVARPAAARLVAPIVLIAGFSTGAYLLAAKVPQGFIPNEDQGMFYVAVTTPPGATLLRTKKVVDEVAGIARALPGVESVATLSGNNVLTDGTGATYGTLLVNLRAWEARSESSAQIMAALRARTAQVQDARIEMLEPPPVPGYGDAGGIQLSLLDKTGRGDPHEMAREVGKLVAALEARPEIGDASTVFEAGFPQLAVDLDVDRAAQLGVTPQRALDTLQTLLGGEYATNFIRFGQLFKVMVEAPPEYRARPDQVGALRVRSDRGDLVPLSAFVHLENAYGPDTLTRYNMYPSAEVTALAAAGKSSGDALRAVQETADRTLPRGFAIDWAGVAKYEVAAGNQGLVIGLIALLFVWLVLAAQYESFLLPAAVLLSLPPGVFGAFWALHAAGLENNVYTHLALVVLIGLLGKNAILIVEYAELRLAEGHAPLPAVLEAARQRLRPILMTSLAFVAGLVPLSLASGAGEISNRTIGTATIGGMIAGTVWGLVIVPGLYVACRRRRRPS